MIISLVIILLLVFGMVIYFLLPKAPIGPYFQDAPETWIEDNSGIKEINVNKITKGEGFLDTQGQQYITKDIGTVFSYHGFYKGEFLRRELTKDGKTVMKINNNVNPNDDIIEGFIVEKLIDDVPILYIFLDEDWKKNVFDTKIYWGKSFENEKQFDFSKQISPGIYMNEIIDDPLRFEDNYAAHLGGVWVGELREDRNSTMIVFN